jgi:hypothetical protein
LVFIDVLKDIQVEMLREERDLRRVLLLEDLGDGLELDVAGSIVREKSGQKKNHVSQSSHSTFNIQRKSNIN